MSNQLRSLVEKFSSLTTLRTTAIERLQAVKGVNQAQFDLSKPAPGVEKTLAEIDARVIAICSIAAEIRADADNLLIPQSLFGKLTKPVDQLTAQYQSIVDGLVNVDQNGGPGALDPDGLTLASKNGQTTVQLGPVFQYIWNHSDSVLDALYPLLNIARGEGIADFSDALRAFSAALKQVHEQRAALAELAKGAEVDRKKIADLQAVSGPLRDEIERLKTESEKDRKTLAEYSSEGTQSITSIRAMTEPANQLKALVDSYSATFETFQKQLDQREKTFQQGAERQTTLLKDIGTIEGRISELNRQAEAMLAGATVAGLAGSFGDLRDKLSDELVTARRAFYLAIVLLFVSVVPLAAYVIPGIGEFLSFSSSGDRVQTASTIELIGQVLTRALLLLPAAWFAKFAAGRHAALFKLKEHYAYKYSVAASVEGFKKQAEPFKDAIAAATFFALTFNPADRMDTKVQEERHPNPAMEWFMKKLGTTYDGKND